jgi:peptidoglycan/xylan/chitin deacetylase (PgdA/CDA1 family)
MSRHGRRARVVVERPARLNVLTVMLAVVLVVIGAVVASQMVPFPFLLEAFRPAQSLWHVKHVKGQPATLYLTFDDGPNAAWTPPLLDALRDQDVRATFFLIDDHITSETAAIVKRIGDEGHAIGLHTGTRKFMIASEDAMQQHVLAASARIRAITGRAPCPLFRPHAGWRSGNMYGGLQRAGYRLAGWSWGMWDWDWWRTPHADRVSRRLSKKASAGDIIVIHDGHHKNPNADRRHAGETVRLMVPVLRARGFEFAPLCVSQ